MLWDCRRQFLKYSEHCGCFMQGHWNIKKAFSDCVLTGTGLWKYLRVFCKIAVRNLSTMFFQANTLSIAYSSYFCWNKHMGFSRGKINIFRSPITLTWNQGDNWNRVPEPEKQKNQGHVKQLFQKRICPSFRELKKKFDQYLLLWT